MTTSLKGLLVGLVALPVLLSFQNCTGVQFSGAGARLVAKGDVTGTDPAINFVDSSGAPVIDLGDGGSSVPMNQPPGGSNGSSGDSGDTSNSDTADNGGSTNESDPSDTADNSNDSSDSSENPVNNPDANENPDVVKNPDGNDNPDVTPEEPTRPGKTPDVAKGKKCPNSNRPDKNVDSEDHGGNLFVCVLEGPGRSQLLHFESDAFNSSVSMPQAVCTTKFACENLVSQKFSVKLAHKRGACGRNPHMVTLSELEIMSLLGL